MKGIPDEEPSLDVYAKKVNRCDKHGIIGEAFIHAKNDHAKIDVRICLRCVVELTGKVTYGV